MAWAGLGLAGCATPGQLHVYFLPSATAPAVTDSASGRATEVPSFLAPGEEITGFAYDPFTDHFFLRLAPGNRIRVVDRPAQAVKREFDVERLPADGGGDLAVKPRTGHLFLLHAHEPHVSELTRLGKWVRTLPLDGLTTPAAGIAFDAAHDHLLVLERGPRATVTTFDLDGRRLRAVTLERAVGPSLAFDAQAREFYAPLAATPGEMGVFDEQGRLRRKAGKGVLIDVGPRSFVRVF